MEMEVQSNPGPSRKTDIVNSPEGTLRKRHSKQKRLKDKNAPPLPKSGYVLFMTERRRTIAQEHPEWQLADINRQLAREWTALEPIRKQMFLDQAAEEKKKHEKELAEYKKTESYRLFRRQLEESRKKDAVDGPELGVFSGEVGVGDIPIFTKEFLDHNRERENELRRLRKEVTSLEEEVAGLERHIAQVEGVTRAMEKETDSQRETQLLLHGHLQELRSALCTAFAKLPLPDSSTKLPTPDTIDQYMSAVHKIVLDLPNEHQQFVLKARSIITKLKLPDLHRVP